MKKALSEIKEKPDQRCQQINQTYVLRNEKIRILIICCSLLAIALAFVLFLFTKNVLPVFFTMLLTFLGYKHLDTSIVGEDRADPCPVPHADPVCPLEQSSPNGHA